MKSNQINDGKTNWVRQDLRIHCGLSTPKEKESLGWARLWGNTWAGCFWFHNHLHKDIWSYPPNKLPLFNLLLTHPCPEESLTRIPTKVLERGVFHSNSPWKKCFEFLEPVSLTWNCSHYPLTPTSALFIHGSCNNYLSPTYHRKCVLGA